MKNAIYSTAAGMLTSAERLNVISNNIANAHTDGFKADIPFEQVIRFYMEEPAPSKDQPLLGGTSLNMYAGAIKNTGRKLDLALEKPEQFFVLSSPGNKGEIYTRNGAFNINSNRELVNFEGLPVKDKFNRNIKIVGESYYFTPGGDVFVDGNYYTSLKIAEAKDRNNIEKVGHSYFRLKNGKNMNLANNSYIVPGALENSNVDLMKELPEMITAQRAFDFQQKSLSLVLSDLTKKLINDVARPV